MSALATWKLDASHAIVVRRPDPGIEPDLGLEVEPAVADGAGWRRARPGDGTAAAFATALAGGTGEISGAGKIGVPDGFRVRVITPVPACGDGERAITVDQTNESVIVAEKLVVKWLVRPPSGPHPGPALLEHLARVGFARIPPAYAAVWWSPPGAETAAETLLALVTGYLPDARDGWDWCVDELLAEWDYGQRAFFPEQLGTLAADLHAALATPSEVFPEPTGLAGAEDLAAWGKQAAATVATAIAETPGTDGAWLRERAARLHADVELPAIGQTPVTRIHGDLHAGQVLRWRGGLAVTDFEPNPAVAAESGSLPAGEPAARDVAQLMTSLAHVAAVADKRTGWRRTEHARAFEARAGAEFLAAYRSRLAAHGVGEIFDERLLRSFSVEQEARELLYAARFLPRWAYAPMSVLRAWYA